MIDILRLRSRGRRAENPRHGVRVDPEFLEVNPISNKKSQGKEVASAWGKSTPDSLVLPRPHQPRHTIQRCVRGPRRGHKCGEHSLG